MFKSIRIASHFEASETVVVFDGDCRRMLQVIPSDSLQLIITSPPYNIGKEYEARTDLAQYVEQQRMVIQECVRALKPTGSICLQVGTET